MTLPIGASAPEFTLIDQNRNQVSLDSLKGRRSVVVFIPFPFTSTCTSELCDLGDITPDLADLDANVVVITCDTYGSNRRWAADNDIEFPVLSDHWPHGAVTQAFDAFDATYGVPFRTSYVLDAEGRITDIIASEQLGTARPVQAYTDALTRLS
jgi:mycoredoxin-dependent peroxiredoxin